MVVTSEQLLNIAVALACETRPLALLGKDFPLSSYGQLPTR